MGSFGDPYPVQSGRKTIVVVVYSRYELYYVAARSKQFRFQATLETAVCTPLHGNNRAIYQYLHFSSNLFIGKVIEQAANGVRLGGRCQIKIE